jgi:hypothetical protein
MKREQGVSRANKRPTAKTTTAVLSPEMDQELEFILDRLRVQHPNGASLESYLQSFRGTFVGKEALAVALVERIDRRFGEVGYRLLQALDGLFPSKVFRKAHRQASYRLVQAGFGEQPGSRENAVAVLVPGEVKQLIAHLSPLSTDGHWFVSMLVADEHQARHLVFALIGFPFQCEDLRTIASSQGDYRAMHNQLAHNFVHPCQEIPVWHAARLVLDLLDKGLVGIGRQHESTVRRLLKPVYDPDHPPYCDELFASSVVPDEQPSEQEVTVLVQELPMAALSFAKEDLKPFWERIRQVDDSILVVARTVKEERVRDIIAEAADRLCSGAMRDSLQRFFEEQAAYYQLRGLTQAAMTLWQTALHLRSGQPAGLSPVILKFLSGSFYFHWQEDFANAGETTPEPEPTTHRTDSGLILLK